MPGTNGKRLKNSIFSNNEFIKFNTTVSVIS